MYKVTISGTTVVREDGIRPESQAVTLTERGSTSTITLGPDAPEISVGEWLLNDEWQEGEQLWRVRSVERQIETNTRTVQLDHAIKLLEDTQIFEDIETSDINGGDDAYARQAIEYVLSLQGDWRLGQFDYENVYQPYEFSGGTSVFDAVESVADTLEDCEWWYDVRTYPFLIHIKHRNATESCEMRSGRNVSTMKVLIDRSGMYTRIYPVGENDLHITGDYISRNENVFGRVDKVETNQGISTEEGLWNWAEGRLLKHSEPVVTITISGLDLSRQTGEQLDWIQLNRVCRCPLPEYGTTILERVTKLNWKDRQNDPETVTVTLSNGAADAETLTKQVSETSKTTGTAARGQAKQNYLFEANGEHLYYEVFDECGHLHSQLEMTEQSLRIGFENLNESTRAEFRMTSESLRVQFENEIASTRSEFQMTSESLRIQFENEIASTRSEFQMTSESLRISFENEIASTRSDFQMTAESLRVSFENEIESTRSEFQMTSESLRLSFENEIASTRSEFQMTSESLRVSFENEIASARSDFQMTAESLRVSFENEISSTRSEFQITSESLRVSFENEISSTRSEFQMTSESLRVTFENEVSSVRSMVEQTDSSWRACVEGVVGADGKVTAASIGVAINANGSNAFIDADHVNITGTTHLNDVMTVASGTVQITKTTMFVTQSGGSVSINNGKVTADTLQSDALTLVGSGDGDIATLEFGDIATMIRKAEVDGSTNTLKLWKLSDPDATPSINFSKATTLTGAWSSTDSSWTVTASPQGNTDKVIIGSKNKNTVGLIREGSEQWISGAEYVHNQYNYGWAAAYAKVSLPGSNTSSATMTVETPTSTVDGAANSTTYTVRSTQNDAYISIYAADGETIVRNCAKVTHGQYTAGQNSVGLNVTVNSSNNVPYNAVITPNKNSSATQSVTVTVSPGSLNTTTGKRTISAMVGTTVADQEDITDFLVGKQNATVTMNTPAWNTVSELSDNRTLVVGAYNTDNSSKSASTTKTIYLVVGDNVAYIRDTTSSGTVVAQVQHDKRLGGYRAGWAAAYGKVSLPGSNESTATMSVSTPPSGTDGNAVTTTYTVRSTKNDAYITVYAQDGQTIVRNCAKVNHGQYNAGWAAAYAKVSLPGSNTSSATMTVQTPTSTVDGNANSTTYTVRSTQNDAYISVYSGETLVMNCAKVNHGQYNAGWAAAYAKVSWPGSNVNSGSMTLKAPASTVGQQESETYSLRVTANEAYITVYGNDGETVVKNCAKVTHNQYNTGWYAGWNDYFDGNYGGAGQWSPAAQYGHTWQSDGSNNTVSGNHYVTIPGKYSNGSYTTWYPLLCVEDEATYLGYAKGSLSIDDIYATNSPPSGTTATNLARQLQTAYQDGYDFVTFRVNYGDTHKRYNIEMW